MSTSLSTLVDGRAIVIVQDICTRRWHEEQGTTSSGRGGSLAELVEAEHAANFALWHAEDEARRPGAADATVAAVKREIDRVNQQRNDLTEQIDAHLLARLSKAGIGEGGEQHSETPGMMIDRLSILSLRQFHTDEELGRSGAPPGHRERNAERRAIVLRQIADLVGCLDRLWAEVCAGRRYFRQYRQLKMYNDPELNPVVYGSEQRKRL